jgi:DNA-binding MarR family transcriptional regulator
MGKGVSIMTDHARIVRETLISVRALGDALDRMHGVMGADMELNSTDLRALRMMVVREQRGESVSPHELARTLLISTASTTKLIDRLVAAGHVERHPHPHDRRGRVLVLTEHARSEFYGHFGQRLAEMRGVVEEFDEEQLRVIVSFLGRMADVLETSSS